MEAVSIVQEAAAFTAVVEAAGRMAVAAGKLCCITA
jgi:hypothetical protein